jgi:AsmA protein
MASFLSPFSKKPVVATLACFALLLCAAVAFAGSMRWSVAPERMRAQLDAAIAHETGYNLTRLDSASFSALPWPNVLATGLELTRKDASGARASIPLLKARISFASWFFGQPRITAIGLRDPILYVPASQASTEIEARASTLFKVFKPDSLARLKTVRIHAGSVVVDGQAILRDVHLKASDVATADFRVDARANYRTVPVKLTAVFGKNAYQARRPVNWSVTSDLGDIAFNGTLLGPRTLDAEGELVVRTAPAEKWSVALGYAPPLITLFGGTAMLGEARMIGPLIQMQNAKIARDEHTLSGSIAFTLADGLPQLTATLDVDRLDLSSLLPAAVAMTREINAPWSTRVLGTQWLDAGRIDLRLSARKLAIGEHVIDQAAGSIHINSGKLEALLSDGRIGRGNLKGRTTISRTMGDELELRASGSFDRMDTAQVLARHGIDRLKGTAHGNYVVEASGTNVAEIIGRMEGRATLLIRDGEVSGADFERMLTRMERGALASPLVMEGRTRFQSLSAQVTIQRGVAELHDSQLSSAALRLPLTGSINLGARILNISARLKAPDGSDPRGGDFTLRAEGPWSRPSLSPDLRPRGGRS